MTSDQTGNPSDGLLLAGLSRWPDVQSENLFAHDATDRLILDLAGDAIAKADDGAVVTIGDRYGALTLGAARLGAQHIRVHQDSFTSRMALDDNAAGMDSKPYSQHPLDETLLRGATVVLLQLPKDLTQLRHWSAMIAAYADPTAQVFAGGRIKHMNHSMNGVLGEFFEDVGVSRARQKSRVLFASRPKTVEVSMVEEGCTEFHDPELDMQVVAYPGVFSAGRVDMGTRFLIPFVEQEVRNMSEAHPRRSLVAVDLGSGTGILTVVLRRCLQGGTVIATDRSEVAARSTRATLEGNFGRAAGASQPSLLRSEAPSPMPWPSLSLSHSPSPSPSPMPWPSLSPSHSLSHSLSPSPMPSPMPYGGVEVRQDHVLSAQPAESVDLVVCNPPFHSEASISTGLSKQIFEDAARALRPGGVMLTVFNSHLHHRSQLARLVGPTTQLGRNSKFTVTRSVKR